MGSNLCDLEAILTHAADALNIERNEIDWTGWVDTFSGGGLVFGPGGACMTKAPVVACMDQLAGIMAIYVGGRYWRMTTFDSRLGKGILRDHCLPRGSK